MVDFNSRSGLRMAGGIGVRSLMRFDFEQVWPDTEEPCSLEYELRGRE